jgi:flagellar biosynthesis/type III secretory pathway chaperone
LESLLNKLTDIVSREVVQFELFLKLLTEQQDYLVGNDVENINRVVKEQEQAILTLKDLEASRIRVVQEISRRTDSDPASMTLSKIAKKFAVPQAEKLARMQQKLLDLHEKVSDTKSRNEFLIKKSMEYIDGTVKMLASHGIDLPTYGKTDGGNRGPKSLGVNRTA